MRHHNPGVRPRYFTGGLSSRDAIKEAKRFRTSGLEIRPLVETIVRGPTFLKRRMNRPRTPVEWLTAALPVLAITDKDMRR